MCVRACMHACACVRLRVCCLRADTKCDRRYARDTHRRLVACAGSGTWHSTLAHTRAQLCSGRQRTGLLRTHRMTNLRAKILDIWKPSAMSMISQISARSGTTMDTGRNRALSDSGSSARPANDGMRRAARPSTLAHALARATHIPLNRGNKKGDAGAQAARRGLHAQGSVPHSALGHALARTPTTPPSRTPAGHEKGIKTGRGCTQTQAAQHRVCPRTYPCGRQEAACANARPHATLYPLRGSQTPPTPG